jgi:dihydrofolate reductase
VLNSASIIRALLDVGLVDERQLWVLPTTLGSGLRFFPEGLAPSTWQLMSVVTFLTGAVGLRYGRS